MYHIFVNIISKVVHSATLEEYLKSHEIFNCYCYFTIEIF